LLFIIHEFEVSTIWANDQQPSMLNETEAAQLRTKCRLPKHNPSSDDLAMAECTLESSETPFLRGGASDIESNQSHVYDNLADDFKRLYNQLLQVNAKAGGISSLPPCTDAWMKLANLLQFRNSILEHRVEELQETNASLIEDVEWHVDAISKLEDALREAQMERTAAFKEVLDLDAQLSCVQKRAGSVKVSTAASSDDESTDTDMADSGPSQSDRGANADVLTHWTFSQNEQGLPRIHEDCTRDGRAKAFCFFPRTALVLLESSPLRWYQFPQGSTLLQIYEDLVRRYNRELRDDPVFQILEILELWDCLGVQYPDELHDEMIRIGLPDFNTVSEIGSDIPLAASEAFHDADEGLNVESWQDWYGLVELTPCPTLGCTYSDLSEQEDAAELFADWSWDIDHSGEAARSIDMSPFTRPGVCHNIPSDSDKSPCLRGGVGDDSSELDGTGPVDAQRCNNAKGHAYHRLSEDNFSAHWPQGHASADNGQINALEKYQKHPKRHVVTKQVPADHCCFRCDFPNPRLYRQARVSRPWDSDNHETAIDPVSEGRRPLWECDVLWKKCKYCLMEVDGNA
jgi:hypothetical protein